MKLSPKLIPASALLGAALSSQAAIEPKVSLSYNDINESFTVSWYGVSAHTYFVQYSVDLHTWQTASLIASGANAPLSWTIQLNSERRFFRVLFTDLPTGGDPATADFDGDGIDNQTEVSLGSHPLSLDGDRDGMLDSWEYAHGFSLYQNDAAQNADNDDLSNLGEFLAGTNPLVADTTVAASSLGLVITSH